MKKLKRYSPVERERAIRLVFDQQGQHSSQWAAIQSIADKIGCTAETLRSWVRQTETREALLKAASILLAQMMILVFLFTIQRVCGTYRLKSKLL